MKFVESWRLFFPAAAALAIGGLAAWASQLGGRALGLAPQDHGAYMIWGVMGAGVQGFLYTAYARQNDAPAPPAALLLVQLLLHLTSAAILLDRPEWPIAATVLLAAAPWLVLLGWLIRVAIPSLRRRWDPTTAAIPVAVAGGLVGLVLHLTGVTAPRGVDVGVHGFLVPTALAVLDRVLPFFSSRVTPGYRGLRRPWFLPALLVVAWVGLVAPPAQRLTAATALLLLIRQVHGWAPWPAARTAAIAALHLGVAWFGVGWAFAALGAPRAAVLHATAVGGMGTLLLAFSMRVAQGHSGLPVTLGRAGVVIVGLAQLAALGRVFAAIGGGAGWLAPSAWALVAAFGGWLTWYGWSRRRRGSPG